MAEELYQLVVIEGPESGHSFQLGLDTIIIGRDKYADIVFDHPEVSRHHARLTRTASGYVLQDQDSTNGTFVDGRKLGDEPVLLQTGMMLRLGGTVILKYQSVTTADPMATVVASSLSDETMISDPGSLPGIQDTLTLIAAETMNNPYVGPRAFEPDERQFFYGRDDEIAILAGQVMSRRASLFFAQSGAGKSSLLRAGLIPDLTRKIKVGRGPRARVVQKMRVMPILEVGYNPSEEQLALTENVYVLGAMLSLYPKRPVEELAALTLCQGLAPYFSQSEGEPAAGDEQPAQVGAKGLSTLLIFDQFEELFTYHPEQWRKREDFFRQVNQALEEYPTLHVVFTMREDFIAELTPYASLLPEQLRARFRLERLKRDAALQAIIAPAEKAGRAFAKGVAEELADSLRRGQPKQDRAGQQLEEEATLGAYVEPVHLQIVCRQLWENLPAKRKVIEAADVHAFGDVDQALIDFYEATLAEVAARTDISQRQLRAWFDQEVITPARTRGLVYRGEKETEGLPNAAADILNDAYIIRADVRGGDIWYQLAHDRLVEPVLGANVVWRENYQNPLDKVTRAWLAAGRDRDRLLAGPQLAIAQAYADENPNDVLPEELEFLRESHRQEQLAAEQAKAQARRRRRTIIAAGVVGAFLLLATIFSITQMILANSARQEADENAQLAEEKRQEAQVARTKAESEAQRADEEAQRAVQSAEQARAAQDVAQRAQTEAEEQRDLAEEQRNEAERQRKEAERQTRLSLAEGLAANALAEASSDINDPSLVLILAREAVNSTLRVDGTVQDNARRALIEAVANTPPWQMNLPRYAHEGAIMRAVFSPDGAKVVTTSDDGTVRIWDASTGDRLLVLRGHGDRVDYATFDGDGGRVVSAGADGVAIVWDAISGEQMAVMAGHSDGVTAANFDPAGERIVTAGLDGSARVWNAESGQELLVLEGQDDFVVWAIFDDAGDRIATASLDGFIRVWDASSGALLVSMEGSGGPIVSANFSGDGEQLVGASWDGFVATFNASNGDLIQVLSGHVDQVNFAEFSPDDQQIVSASDDRTIRIWDSSTGELLDVIGGSGSPIMEADFNDDGTRLAVGSIDGTVIVWDVETGEDLLRIKAHEFNLSGFDFSPNSQLIATADSNGPARIWDAESGELVQTIVGHDGAVVDVAFSPDSASVATVGTDGQLRVTDVGSGDLRIYRTDVGEPDGLKFVIYSNDGSRIATYDEVGQQIQIRGATTGEVYLSMRDKSGIESIQFSPDVKTLLTGNIDGTITLWDVYSGANLDTLQAHGNYVRSAAFSPDGSYIVTASDDTTARVWDVETGDDEYTLLGHGDWLTYATFSPDGRLIASTDLDGVTKIWNIAAPALIPQLEYANSGQYQLTAYTPDGQRMVTTVDDFEIKVWGVESGRELRSISGRNLDQTPLDRESDLALLPVLTEGGTVDVWDVSNDQLVINVYGNDVYVSAADVSADGRMVLTLGCDTWDEEDGFCTQPTAIIWDVASGQRVQTFPYDEALGEKTFDLSNDGSHLVVGYCAEYDDEGITCLESQLTIWDTRTGGEISSWSIGDGPVLWIDYSPDQSGIFTTNRSETRFWNAESGELLQEVSGQYKTTDPQGLCIVTLTGNFSSAMIWDIRTGELLGTLSGHRDLITSIEFSPDSERLITSSWDNTARVWNSRTGVEILNVDDHEGQVWQAHFSPDGTSIVTAGEDGTARIWPFAADKLLELSEPAVQRYAPFLTPVELARFGLAGN